MVLDEDVGTGRIPATLALPSRYPLFALEEHLASFHPDIDSLPPDSTICLRSSASPCRSHWRAAASTRPSDKENRAGSSHSVPPQTSRATAITQGRKEHRTARMEHFRALLKAHLSNQTITHFNHSSNLSGKFVSSTAGLRPEKGSVHPTLVGLTLDPTQRHPSPDFAPRARTCMA